MNRAINHLYIFLILGLITISSCEKIIDVTLPERDKKIVVNSAITPDSLIIVNLSKSIGVFDDEQVDFINNANIEIYSDGILIDQLILINQMGNYSSSTYYPVLGQNYYIKINVPDITPVTANCTIPYPVEIISWDTTSFTNNWGEESMRASINFDDPDSIDNYYWFRAKTIETYVETDSLGFLIYDDNKNPITYEDEGFVWIGTHQINSGIEDGADFQNGLFFSDKLFSGNSFELNFELFPFQRLKRFPDIVKAKLILELHSVTKDFFLYASSYSRHINTQGITFLEPIQVYNNIDKGFGIFAGYSTHRDSLILFDLLGNQ